MRRLRSVVRADIPDGVEDTVALFAKSGNEYAFPDEPEARAVDVIWPSSAVRRRRFASSSALNSCLPFVNASLASSRTLSSSATRLSPSGSAYLFLTSSSASFLRFSMLFSSRNRLRTRDEWVKGSAL